MKPLVGIIMGSTSDWETIRHASETLDTLAVAHEVEVVSSPPRPGQTVPLRRRCCTPTGHDGSRDASPRFRRSRSVQGTPGMDSLLSIAQMPAGTPVGTLAIGRAGAINAALLATAILGNKYSEIREALVNYRTKQSQAVLENPHPQSSDL